MFNLNLSDLLFKNLVYLVPEENETLTELEIFQIVVFDEGDAHCVEACEEPTAAGTLLVRHRLDFVDLEEINDDGYKT